MINFGLCFGGVFTVIKQALLIVLLVSGNIAIAQPCPKWGDATTPEKKQLNIFKNASVRVSASRTPEDLPLNKLITSRKRKDKGLFMDGAYVITEGWLVSFEEEGPESCNCQKATKKKKNGDVHMYVGLKKNAAKKDCIVVEITPEFKKKNPDYATLLEENTKIRITGFLLYDFLHENAATNSCSACTNVWRRTCWEIHPVTEIEKL